MRAVGKGRRRLGRAVVPNTIYIGISNHSERLDRGFFMHKGHPICKISDENAKIWRYMSYEKFESLLKERKLYFAQVEMYDDKFEGWSPGTDEKRHALFEVYKKHTYANCWHIKNHESHLMWEVYAKDKGIAIQSTFKRLRGSLKRLKELNDIDEYIGEVKYIDIDFDSLNTIDNTLIPFFRKSKEYDDEHEIRAIIQIIDPKEWDSYNNEILIPVQLDELIENIYVYPDAEEDFYNSVQTIVNKCGLKMPVKHRRKSTMENGSKCEVPLIVILSNDQSCLDSSGNLILNNYGANIRGQKKY
ncbi:MAG: hypothetical protein J5U17_06065 [Candidatus Methanoperedens sp.]|nr:hypothetical protein [Candidatus Methanoperedens sp.]MCE8429668.1 hypothetical protein [Candidatus Methanoperedens sp.]